MRLSPWSRRNNQKFIASVMLSRRSVRIKALQLLYMLNRDTNLTYADIARLYEEKVNDAYVIYALHLYALLKVAQVSELDAEIRAAKHLPTEADKRFKPILFNNPCAKSLANNVGFLKLATGFGHDKRIDVDQIRRLYNRFAETPAYLEYLELPDPQNADHIRILQELYKFLLTQEVFVEITEDSFSSWHDDESLVIGAMKKTLKAMPLQGAFYEEHLQKDPSVKEFGAELIQHTCLEDVRLFNEIEPMLKNWDSDRVAVLDMIMLKMALAELLYCPTIPVKVTLNEYVEISKLYSSDKSKEFINGILDRLMKKLEKEGRIVKEGRGLLDN